jgi:hypothetical protein
MTDTPDTPPQDEAARRAGLPEVARRALEEADARRERVRREREEIDAQVAEESRRLQEAREQSKDA